MDDLDRSTVPGPNAPPFEQIALALIGAVDPEKPPPEKGVWRQVLRLTGLKGQGASRRMVALRPVESARPCPAGLGCRKSQGGRRYQRRQR